MGRNDGGVDDDQAKVIMPRERSQSPKAASGKGTPGEEHPKASDSTSNSASDSHSPDDSNWQVTERLLQTLNQELGGLKEYVLTELRGEITSLRSEKVQLQSEVQELRHQQEQLLSDRQQAQQQQWAEQFAQVLTQNLRQQLQTEVFGLTESGDTAQPEQRLVLLHQQMVSLEAGLGAAMQALQQELGQHHSDLSQQLLRMQSLEQQGETLLAALVQQLKAQQADQQEAQQEAQPASAGVAQVGAAIAQDAAETNTLRLPGHPTDVASVMAAMASLQPPTDQAEAQERQERPSLDASATAAVDAEATASQAAALPRPPRLTVPAPANPAASADAAGPDESFIADFPIDMVRPGAKPSPPAAQEVPPATADSHAVGQTGADLANLGINRSGPALGGAWDGGNTGGQLPGRSPAPDSPQASTVRSGGIAMPPGMVDRFTEQRVEPPAPELDPWLEDAPRSPWAGEPPTTIGSLLELTDGALTDGAMASDAWTNSTAANGLTRSGDGSTAAEQTAPALAGVAAGNIAFAPAAAAPEHGPASGGAAVSLDLDGGEAARGPGTTAPLKRSGVVIALLALLLWAVQYATVQVLFHGAAWIADGEGFIAATWSSALVTYWIRMLMVLPFMIVIGQGLYPPLLPEIQAVFRDRDPIPLVSIAASSLFFFLAHFLLYGAIAQSSATPAISLFFLYPALGQLLGWGLFNQRLGTARLLAMVPLVLGAVWLLVSWTGEGGRLALLASSVCYALFVMLTAVNGRRMNSMTLTVLQFALAWVCAFPALFFLPRAVPTNDIGYVMACALLSATVGLSQLFGLAGRRRLGAGLSAVIQGTVPLAVGLVCLFLTDEVLPLSQVFGVLLVSAGAIALGLQRTARDPIR